MFSLRPMQEKDWFEVSNLIYLSTNSWYEKNRGHAIFTGGPEVAQLFPEVYEDLDPGCAIVAEHNITGMIVGSCFFHPRETHVSLGIMNVHPNFFGARVGATILEKIIEFAEDRELPLRLVSSAMNLDSFSLYSRYGFSPYATYQDMFLKVPAGGLSTDGLPMDHVRIAELADVPGMGRVEFAVSGFSRMNDYCYFVENEGERWKTLVYEGEAGEIDGFLVSVNSPGSKMLGPGIMCTAEQAEALIVAQLNNFKGASPVFLIPSDQPTLVQKLYRRGARNCELHFGQQRGGDFQPIAGIVMPTFMPETA